MVLQQEAPWITLWKHLVYPLNANMVPVPLSSALGTCGWYPCCKAENGAISGAIGQLPHWVLNPTCVCVGEGGACACRRGPQADRPSNTQGFPLQLPTKESFNFKFFSARFKVLEPSKGKLEIS